MLQNDLVKMSAHFRGVIYLSVFARTSQQYQVYAVSHGNLRIFCIEKFLNKVLLAQNFRLNKYNNVGNAHNSH